MLVVWRRAFPCEHWETQDRAAGAPDGLGHGPCVPLLLPGKDREWASSTKSLAQPNILNGALFHQGLSQRVPSG